MTSDAIPQRLMDEAREIARGFFDARNHEGGFASAIAAALLAAKRLGAMEERERCAKVAEQRYDKIVWGSNAAGLGELIAAGIRNQPEPEAP